MERFYKLMKVVCEIFENHKLHYWFDFGGLLGIIRDGKLISYDHDIDYGIFLEDFSILEKTKNDFAKAGYTLCLNECYPGPLNFPRIYQNKNLLADIFLWHEPLNDGYLKIAKWRNDERNNNIKTPKPFFKNLTSITSQGIQIPIPSYVEILLQLRYGFYWRMPDANFYQNYTFVKSNQIRSEQIKIMEKAIKKKENYSNFESWSDWDIKINLINRQIKLL
jgi:phosphorylcholine metabolism protein LicD